MYYICLEYELDIGGEMGHHLFETFWGIFWRMGQALLYALCVERLRHSFRNTKYESSPRTFIVCYGGIFIFVSGYLVKIILYSFFNATGQRDEFVYALVGDIEMGITQILDFTLSIGIMVLFMRKLHELNTDLADIGDTHSPTKSIANRSNASTHSGLTVLGKNAVYILSSRLIHVDWSPVNDADWQFAFESPFESAFSVSNLMKQYLLIILQCGLDTERHYRTSDLHQIGSESRSLLLISLLLTMYTALLPNTANRMIIVFWKIFTIQLIFRVQCLLWEALRVHPLSTGN